MSISFRSLGLASLLAIAVPACSSDSADQGGPQVASNAGGASPLGTGGGPSSGGGTGSGGAPVGGVLTGGSTSSGATASGGGSGPLSGGANSGGGSAAGGAPSGGGTGSGSGSGGAPDATGGSSTGGDSTGGSSSGGSSGPGADGSTATISGRQLLLDGQPFHIRGVNWNPVPKGANHPEGLDYAGFADQDIALMKAAGINAVRTYERLEDTTVLDKLHAAGIYVFSTVYGWHQDDPSVVTDRVNAAKDHPAILAWVIGNEWNYNQLYSNDGDTAGARAKLNQAAAAIKAADGTHLVASIWGGTGGLGETVDLMPDIDLWGINFYGGLSLDDPLNGWPSAGDGPMFFGEYGADAYNANTGQVDESAQAEATRVLTQAIIDNYATESGGVTIGGFIFEWSDEWWKDSGGAIDVQDVGGIAPGGGPHPDQTFNEEFWGIVDIDRNPRPAYEELKILYTQ